MFTYIITLLLFACCGLGANPRSMDSNLSHTAFYKVFPVPGSDINATASFLVDIIKPAELGPLHLTKDNAQDQFFLIEISATQLSKVSGHAGIDHIIKAEPSVVPRAPVIHYAMHAADVNNVAQIKETTQYLKSITSATKDFWNDSKNFKGFRGWMTDMTEAQADQAAKHPGVGWATPSCQGERASRVRRQPLQYATQLAAPVELVSISQPSTIPDVSILKNYVYEAHGGSKSYIYLIEPGVAWKKYPSEFPNRVPDQEHIWTPGAMEAQRDEGANHPDYAHATCVADKALGQQYGVAKNAKLISVMTGSHGWREYLWALEDILADLQKHPERQKHSVITHSVAYSEDGGCKIATARGDAEVKAAMQALMDMGGVIVAASGNYADKPGRGHEIDTYPALFAADDFPLIVVGACDAEGNEAPFSQGGSKLTTCALGVSATCFGIDTDADPNTPATDVDGTSMTTPMVAGHIANLLSYDTVPIDMTTGKVAKNMRDYIKTHPDAGWERKPGHRMLWNGVTEQHNQLNIASLQSTRDCAGLAADGDKYVGRETLRAIIQDQFCPGIEGQTSRLDRYHTGTMEDVVFEFSQNIPPQIFKMTTADCMKYLLELTDSCDIPGENNPANYKGGGVLTLHVGEKQAVFKIRPQMQRQPAKLGVDGSCDWKYGVGFNQVTIWGHGWLSSDWGARLKKELWGCALFPNTWKFEYGLRDGVREWSATFRTGVFQSHCTGNAAKTAGGSGFDGCKHHF